MLFVYVKESRKAIQMNGYSRSPQNWLWNVAFVLIFEYSIASLGIYSELNELNMKLCLWTLVSEGAEELPAFQFILGIDEWSVLLVPARAESHLWNALEIDKSSGVFAQSGT